MKQKRPASRKESLSEGLRPSDDANGRFPALELPIQPPFPPMEAQRSSTLPKGEDWLFEPKWDGFRAVVFRDGDEVVLQSKAGQSLGRYFPELLEALRGTKSRKFVLDGEIVIPVKGHLSFDDLLLRIHPAASRVQKLAVESPARLFIFDLLVEPQRQGPRSIVDQPLLERRKRLEKLLEAMASPALQLSPATLDRKLATRWFEEFGELGLDGVMAKRSGEHYHSGDRDGMVKVKHFNTVDCVVGGFRYAAGTKLIGSLLLGLHDDEGRLVFVGHTSSFNKTEKNDLKSVVEPLISDNPFEVRVPGGPSRWSTEKSGDWTPLRPQLVCEVEYDYYSQGRFRHGSRFLRWRPDKKPSQCGMDQVESKKEGRILKDLGMD